MLAKAKIPVEGNVMVKESANIDEESGNPFNHSPIDFQKPINHALC